MIRAILFDMDGVLVDSEPAHAAATNDALRQLGLPEVDAAGYERAFFGRPDHESFAAYFARIGQPANRLDDALHLKQEAFARRFLAEVRPFEDGIEALREAHARGYLVAVVTGARRSELLLVLERFSLGELVDTALSADDVERGKPDPLPYLMAAQRLGIDPDACLVVEDTPAGVEAARAAGMTCLAVDRLGRPERLDGASLIVPALDCAAIASLLERHS